MPKFDQTYIQNNYWKNETNISLGLITFTGVNIPFIFPSIPICLYILPITIFFLM